MCDMIGRESDLKFEYYAKAFIHLFFLKKNDRQY